MNRFFHAVVPAQDIVNGPAGVVQDWIARYVNILFPKNGIDYWSQNEYSTESLKADSPLPTVGSVACYVRRGSNEGRVIEVELVHRNGRHRRRLTWAKTFGTAAECWEQAHAISEALESLFMWEELPELVAMAEKLPKRYPWERETSLKEPVIMETSDTELTVKTATGTVLSHHDFSKLGASARFAVAAYQRDWVTVLTNMKANIDGLPIDLEAQAAQAFGRDRDGSRYRATALK